MTEFSSVVEFRADLQRRFDALDELLRANRAAIVQTEREQEMVALQIATVDRVMAMQPPMIVGEIDVPPARPGTFSPPVLRDWCEEHNRGSLPNGLCPECEARNQQRTSGSIAPRQRQDVRGPVLALIRNSATELAVSEICKLLPDLKPASVRATLDRAVQMGIIGGENGLYFKRASAPPTPEAALAGGNANALGGGIAEFSTPQDDRQGEDSDRHPHDIDAVTGTADDQGLYHTERSVPRYPNTFAHTTEPDPRALANDTPEEQARALRAAIEKAGAVGVDEDNSCVSPDVIAAGIEAGWLSRTEDDKGIMRLRIAEGQEVQ